MPQLNPEIELLRFKECTTYLQLDAEPFYQHGCGLIYLDLVWVPHQLDMHSFFDGLVLLVLVQVVPLLSLLKEQHALHLYLSD